MNLYRNIKKDELPILLRAVYTVNNGDIERTAHDLETIDLSLSIIKMRSLINKHNGRIRHDYRKALEAVITRGGGE